jgi:hypothetical protein
MDGEMIGRGETDPWQKKKENTNEIKTGTNIHLFPCRWESKSAKRDQPREN